MYNCFKPCLPSGEHTLHALNYFFSPNNTYSFSVNEKDCDLKIIIEVLQNIRCLLNPLKTIIKRTKSK